MINYILLILLFPLSAFGNECLLKLGIVVPEQQRHLYRTSYTSGFELGSYLALSDFKESYGSKIKNCILETEVFSINTDPNEIYKKLDEANSKKKIDLLIGPPTISFISGFYYAIRKLKIPSISPYANAVRDATDVPYFQLRKSRSHNINKVIEYIKATDPSAKPQNILVVLRDDSYDDSKIFRMIKDKVTIVKVDRTLKDIKLILEKLTSSKIKHLFIPQRIPIVAPIMNSVVNLPIPFNGVVWGESSWGESPETGLLKKLKGGRFRANLIREYSRHNLPSTVGKQFLMEITPKGETFRLMSILYYDAMLIGLKSLLGASQESNNAILKELKDNLDRPGKLFRPRGKKYNLIEFDTQLGYKWKKEI